MPDMIEMSEEEARTLRGSKTLMDNLLKSPKTRREAEKLVKTLYPETTTTDDVVEPYVQKIDALEKRLDEYLKGQEGKELDSKFNQQISQLREEGYTEEGIEKIKKLMVDEQLPNALAAAAYWEKKNPPKPAENSNFAPTDWGFGRKTEDKNLNLLFQDEDAWAEQEAKLAWDEETRKKGQILT
jgi:chemotaxis protein histidine kinase CheA